MVKAIAITGPTASGKTALSISLARELKGEIISLDSMQIYRGMDIGTAKATREERDAVPHHMLDVCDPSDSFSAKDYRDMALPIAEDIAARGGVPIFVGGTGLYLSTLLLSDNGEIPPSDKEYRDRILSTLITEEDKIALWERLRRIDAEAAEATHYNNTRRVIRAIEIYEKTGHTKSYYDRLSRLRKPSLDIIHLTIDFHSRDTLYDRIDRRVELMMSEGLAEEVTSLYERGALPPESTAAQAIGYKEIIACLKSGVSADLATEQIKQASRNYAKRQLTWFRRAEGAHTLYADLDDGKMKSSEALLAEALTYINNK